MLPAYAAPSLRRSLSLLGVMEVRRERQASIYPTEAHSFVASKYCKWRKGSRPRKGSRSVAWLDGMVETLVSARKALEPTSYPRLQDFLDALQSFEAYLRFQPALIFPLAASRQLRRALTIRYRDSSGDSNIPGTSLDQGVSSHSKSFQQRSR